MSRPLDRFFDPQRKRGQVRLPVARSVRRVRGLLIGMAVVFSLAAGRAVQVQAIDATNVAAEAAQQITVVRALPAFRGEITDRNGEVLAMTADTVKVLADAKAIATNGRMDAELTPKDREVVATAPARIADLLFAHLGGNRDEYLATLTKTGRGSQFGLIAAKVPAAKYREIAQAMSEAGLLGLSSQSNPTRVLPNGSLAAHILGYINEQGVGAGGLEYALNSTLAGTPGKEVYENSPNGKIPMGNNVLTPAQNGQNYQLTIDAGMQWQVEQILAERVRQTKADGAMAIVTNIKTGEVLALANVPTFDPTNIGAADKQSLRLRAIEDAYTPGSVQKTLTFAALIDQGLVKATDVVEIPGQIRSGDNYIHDAWTHGKIKLLARGIVAKSSNIGTILLARKMTKQSLHDYLVSFGLGARTGLGLAGESAGILPAANMPDYTRDGLAFGGSGVSVTMVQEAAAVGAIANGGIYNAPHVVASRTKADGTVEQLPLAKPHRVVSERTSKEVVSMMESVVMQSTSHTFNVDGYRTGAKTGTSKKLDPTCNCFKGLVVSTIGVGPVEDPQVLVYVVVDNPQRGSSGGSVAGPAYQDIMSIALPRYGVTPSKTKSPTLPIEP
ncbi:MAG: peptidoglycan D,D-transpeptidase FtsI family protein [Propionicimonas sp.]